VEQLQIRQSDRVLPFYPQLEDEPVRHVDKVFVQHRQTAQNCGLPVIAAVHVCTWIVHVVCRLPLDCAPTAQIAVSRRGQSFPESFGRRIEALINKEETLPRASLAYLCGRST